MGIQSFEELKEAFLVASRKGDKQVITEIAGQLEEIGTDEAAALAHVAYGDARGVEGNYVQSIQHYGDALAIYRQTGDSKGETNVVGKLGSVYWRQGDYSHALEILQKALSMATTEDDQETVATLLGNMGIIFFETADYSTALEYYQRSLALYQRLVQIESQARTLVNIGIVYGAIDDYELSLEYMFRALKLFEDSGHQSGKANVMGNIGVAYAQSKQFDDGRRWLEQAISLAKELEMSREQGFYLCALADVMIEAGQTAEALALIDEHDSILQENPTPATHSLMIRGGVSAADGDYEKAKAFLLAALKQTDERGERSRSADIHKNLRDVCKDAGDFEGYITHNEMYQSLTEEIKGSTSTRKLTMQEKERELDEERKQRDAERVAIEVQRDKERAVLYGALPQHVADRLIRGEEVTDSFPSASVLFLDIAGFTRIASLVPPGHVVHLLESIFTVCDDIVLNHGLTKVKTIGDSYMAVAGVPEKQADHVDRMARAATQIQSALTDLKLTMPPALGDTSWVKDIGEVHARVGIHCGPVVAGVVGKERLQYDVWGDAVNVASRMESSGEPGKVQASQDFVNALSDRSEWHVEARIAFEIKGKGMMQTYWLQQRNQ